MKIIFVGMHNKAGKIPLSSSTRSGKLIDRIVSELKPIQCLKTNLYDVDEYPRDEDKSTLARDWHERINPKLGDVVVLLGAEVHNNYITNLFDNVIKIPHPSSMWSHVAMTEYVNNAVKQIKKLIKRQHEHVQIS